MAWRVPPVLRYFLAPGKRRQEDHAAHRELLLEDPSLLAKGLSVSWLGTAGFRLEYEGHVLFIDPYVTRAAFPKLIRGAAHADPVLVHRHLGQARAILVGHTHFDHAVDVPLAAKLSGARVYGSSSATHLMDLHGLREQATQVEPYKPYEEGPFTVTFVPSRHSRLAFGLAVPASGELCCDHLDGLSAGAYRCGDVYGIHIDVAGIGLYHHGSADLVDDAVKHRGVDVFLAGIAGRGFTDRYWERILPLLEPRLVVPHHYDDFFRPLKAPLEFSFNVNLAACAEEVRRVSRDFAFRTLPLAAPQQN